MSINDTHTLEFSPGSQDWRPGEGHAVQRGAREGCSKVDQKQNQDAKWVTFQGNQTQSIKHNLQQATSPQEVPVHLKPQRWV